ncbi:hypothetical protein [Methylobacterium currus]|uniref:hypothetical protein n=1 Tax=Methylobacterium currus TaxID=2051553 RepID=UPI000F4FADA9|nr:hypothetical protein [Methylobacterium currus]
MRTSTELAKPPLIFLMEPSDQTSAPAVTVHAGTWRVPLGTRRDDAKGQAIRPPTMKAAGWRFTTLGAEDSTRIRGADRSVTDDRGGGR